MSTIFRPCVVGVLSLMLLGAVALRAASAQTAQIGTLQAATTVLQEIQRMPGQSIPQGLLGQAKAVVIIPNMLKIGFIGAVRHGSGVAMVRNADRTWGNPIFVTMTGGGVGFQAGVQATDVILVFTSNESVATMLRGRFTIGADAAAAAGPVGRQAAAATDLRFRAEILSYSRSRGLFVGVSLDGSVLSVDRQANAVFYHVAGGDPGQIIAAEGLPLPPAAVTLKTVLAMQSGAPVAGPTPAPPPTVAPGGLPAGPVPAVPPPTSGQGAPIQPQGPALQPSPSTSQPTPAQPTPTRAAAPAAVPTSQQSSAARPGPDGVSGGNRFFAKPAEPATPRAVPQQPAAPQLASASTTSSGPALGPSHAPSVATPSTATGHEGQQPTTPADGRPARPQTAPPSRNPEDLGRAIRTAHDALAKRLDDRWRAYLALPLGLADGSDSVDPHALLRTIERFERVAGDPTYKIVADTPGFRETLTRLKQFRDLARR